MEVKIYLEKMRAIQSNLIEYLDDSVNTEEHYQNLLSLFDDQKIRENTHKLKSLLHLILNISNNHNRSLNFFPKVERILQLFTNEIKQTFSNYEIFNIFKSNKRLLLFLFGNKILKLDKPIAIALTNYKYKIEKYPHYFFSEIEPFLSKEMIEEISEEMTEKFEEKREIGENDNYICKLIRSDSIDDFIKYVKQTEISLSIRFNPSIYETNKFLLNRRFLLIEYAAFFGSIKIFKYLFESKAKYSPNLWLYAIHSQNSELIQFLIDNQIQPKNNNYESTFLEAIKCHHNELANFVNDKLLQTVLAKSLNAFHPSAKYYNFAFLQLDIVKNQEISDLCRYDHIDLVEFQIKNIENFENILFFFKFNKIVH